MCGLNSVRVCSIQFMCGLNSVRVWDEFSSHVFNPVHVWVEFSLRVNKKTRTRPIHASYPFTPPAVRGRLMNDVACRGMPFSKPTTKHIIFARFSTKPLPKGRQRDRQISTKPTDDARTQVFKSEVKDNTGGKRKLQSQANLTRMLL
jgi:hypothetical protein